MTHAFRAFMIFRAWCSIAFGAALLSGILTLAMT